MVKSSNSTAERKRGGGCHLCMNIIAGQYLSLFFNNRGIDALHPIIML